MLRAASLLSALLWACSETDLRSGAAVAQAGSSGSMAAGGDAAGSDAAGRSAAESGAAGSDAAGSDAIGSNAGQAGMTSDVSSLAGAGSAGSDPSVAESGGAAGAASKIPSLCDLVVAHGEDPAVVSTLIGKSYRQILDGECRYSGLKCGVGFPDQIAFANQLASYGLDLWHCNGWAAGEFLLAYPGRAVNQADAEALVEVYVTLTVRRLLLSDSDGAGLRKDLLELMPAALAADAAPISLCDSAGVCPLSGPAGGAGSGGMSGASSTTGGTTNKAGSD